MVGAAATSHTHSTYALTSHTHSGYASSTHNHDTVYSKLTHTHSTYAAKSHTHAASDITGLTSGSSRFQCGIIKQGETVTLSFAASLILISLSIYAGDSVYFLFPNDMKNAVKLSSDGKTITNSNDPHYYLAFA